MRMRMRTKGRIKTWAEMVRTSPEDSYDAEARLVRYTVVTCCHCGERTIYAKQWLTMEGWAMDRVTRKWLCPSCVVRMEGRRDGYDAAAESVAWWSESD